MNKYIRIVFTLTVITFLAACQKPGPDQNQPQDSIKYKISVPRAIETQVGATLSFNYYGKPAPEKDTHSLVFRPSSGNDVVIPLTLVDDKLVYFVVPIELETGSYSVWAKFGSEEKKMGDSSLIVEIPLEIDEPSDPKINVYGIVHCNKKGVEGVVVSDGYRVVKTDANGIYQFESSELLKTVFISVPSGYEVISDNILPRFHKSLDGNPNTKERVDFELVEVNNGDHIMYVLGDMHLANRTNDIIQFGNFTSDLQAQIDKNKSKRQYALTLGDMTWELYWTSNNFNLLTYLNTINQSLTGIHLFNTIGNHDHDMYAAGDFDTVIPYRENVGPTYYSFNIGDIHYIVLDDIWCKNTGEGTSASRSYNSKLTSEQLAWLEKDLSHVDKSKKLVIAMHAQAYNKSGSNSMASMPEIEALVRDFPETHILTGHTHQTYNNDKLSSKKIFHHNSGAVCGTWWWTGYYTGIGMGPDGSPSGYYIYNMNGTDIKWTFKATGKSTDFQFRTYDRNKIELTAANYASAANPSITSIFETSVGDWKYKSSDNYVYFTVFDYDPAWKIEVKENDNVLTYEKISNIKDPLHLLCYEAVKANLNQSPTSSFKANGSVDHMFRVKATSATSTLKFKITDRFGRDYYETMTRPKEFNLSVYK